MEGEIVAPVWSGPKEEEEEKKLVPPFRKLSRAGKQKNVQVFFVPTRRLRTLRRRKEKRSSANEEWYIGRTNAAFLQKSVVVVLRGE